jgi:TPR repeat protein
VGQDYAEAMKWYRKAADQGHAASEEAIGSLYEWGQGVAKDDTEAVKWYRRAAIQGYPPAQADLGFEYEAGSGVPKDDVLAHMWLDLAASQGYDLAAKERDKLAAKMTPDQIAEAQRLTREWKPTK